VWPFVVVRGPPTLDVPAGFGQVVELLHVQQLVSKAAVKRLDVAVLPRRARLDVKRLNVRLHQMSPKRLSNELGAIVATNMTRHAARLEQLHQHVEHSIRSDAATDIQRQAFASKLIDDDQALERTTVTSRVVNEVHRPHMILELRSMTNAAAFAVTQTCSFSLLLRHFQSFLTPQTIDPLGVHLPTILT